MQKQTWGARSSLSAGEPYRSVREEQWPGDRGCFWLVFVRETLLPVAHQCGCGHQSWGRRGYICVLESSLRQAVDGWHRAGLREPSAWSRPGAWTAGFWEWRRENTKETARVAVGAKWERTSERAKNERRGIFTASGKTHLKIQSVQLSIKAASLNS